MKAKASISTVSFRIDIDFPLADVDVALREAMASGVQTPVPSLLSDGAQIPINQSKLANTPTAGSVSFCLNWLMGCVNRNTLEILSSRWYNYNDPESLITINNCTHTATELDLLGIEAIEFYELCQGTCHLICEVPFEKFNAELVEKATAVIQQVFDTYCIYYDISKPPCVIQEDAEDNQLRAYDQHGNVLGEEFEEYEEAVMRMWLLGYRPATQAEEETFNLPEPA